MDFYRSNYLIDTKKKFKEVLRQGSLRTSGFYIYYFILLMRESGVFNDTGNYKKNLTSFFMVDFDEMYYFTLIFTYILYFRKILKWSQSIIEYVCLKILGVRSKINIFFFVNDHLNASFLAKHIALSLKIGVRFRHMRRPMLADLMYQFDPNVVVDFSGSIEQVNNLDFDIFGNRFISNWNGYYRIYNYYYYMYILKKINISFYIINRFSKFIHFNEYLHKYNTYLSFRYFILKKFF